MSWGTPPAGPPPGFEPGGSAPFGGPPSGSLAPDRSALVLVLSMSSLMAMAIGCFACGPLSLLSLGLSIPAVVIGQRDLRAMDAGRMVVAGRDATRAGLVIGIVSSAMSLLLGLVMLLSMLLYGGLIGAAILMGDGPR